MPVRVELVAGRVERLDTVLEQRLQEQPLRQLDAGVELREVGFCSLLCGLGSVRRGRRGRGGVGGGRGGESGGRDDEAEDEGRFTGFGVDGGELGPAGGASQLGSGRKNNVLRPDDECERRECGGDVSNWPPKLDKNASLMTMGLTVV